MGQSAGGNPSRCEEREFARKRVRGVDDIVVVSAVRDVSSGITNLQGGISLCLDTVASVY